MSFMTQAAFQRGQSRWVTTISFKHIFFIMHDWFAPRILFPILERFADYRFWSRSLALQNLQWDSSLEGEQRVLERLQSLIQHAYEHVPYYRTLMENAGVSPRSVKELSDLAAIPTSSRSNLRKGFPREVIAQNLPSHRMIRYRTSGSTGLPLEFYRDLGALDELRSTYLFFWNWAGIGPWVTEIRVSNARHYDGDGKKTGLAGRMVRRILLGERVIRLLGSLVNVEDFLYEVSCAAGRGGYYVYAFPSYAENLASQILEKGFSLPETPRVMLSFGETLTLSAKKTIGKAFRCSVLNQYGLTEVPLVAQTCPDNPDCLHVDGQRVIVRIVRDDGLPASDGERGRVIITDLSNYVMPLINYDTGDVATAVQPCTCGRALPTIGPVEGRSADVIRSSDGRIWSAVTIGEFLVNVCGAMPYIWEYQAIQISQTQVVLKVVPTRSFSSEFAGLLERRFQELLGDSMEFSLETCRSIEWESSGKRPIILPLNGGRRKDGLISQDTHEK